MPVTKRKSANLDAPIWFDGTNINEALFCDEFLSSRKIIFANGAFFTPDGRVTDDLPLRGEIYEKLKCCAVNNIPRKITNILEVMKLAAHVEDFAPEADRIHLAIESPYQSPTDMGVNMAGYAIVDDDACRDAARLEIVRRYFAAAVHLKRTGTGEEQVERLRSIMNRAGVTPDLSPARAVALEKEAATGAPAGAMVLPDGHVVTGKTGDLLGAASALLMHALKAVTGVDETIPVIDDAAIEPICRLKTEHLNSVNRRLHSDETLIALSITSATSPVAARVIDGLKQLRGCDAFFSVIISSTDEALYRKLGINVCCEPKYERVSLYHR